MISFLPRTILGKWSVIMMISSWFLFVVGSVLPWKTGYSGLEIAIQNPLQGVVTVLLLGFGVATVILAMISVIKKKERSILVLLAILSGLYSILAFVGSIANVFFNFG